MGQLQTHRMLLQYNNLYIIIQSEDSGIDQLS